MMNQRGLAPLVVLIVGAAGLFFSLTLVSQKNYQLFSLSPVHQTFAATSISRYDVFELTLTYPASSLSDPYNNAIVNATFTSPSGKNLNVPGFYYDINTYKVRFSPSEIGDYSYSASITGPTAFTPQTGTFTSVASSNHGPIRRVPSSSYKLVFDDGTPFYGIGLNDCWTGDANLPNITTMQGVIGELATEPAGEGGQVPINTYFQKYAAAGFNLHRWNPGNCSFKIFNAPNPVLAGKFGDQLLSTAKANGFHNLYTFFYDTNSIPDPIQHPAEDTAFKNYVRYAVARFGAYVDMWEWTNETTTTPSDAWMVYAKNYLRTIDADQKLITNSNPRAADANFLDFSSPHKYGSFSDFYSLSNKTSGIPMIIGELGRCAGCSTAAYNQQIRAKMRSVDWTAYIGGVGVIYWNSSWKTTCCNQYMGSIERAENTVLKNVVLNTPVDVNATPAQLTTGVNRTGYSLTSSQSVIGYVYDNNFSSSGVNTTITLNVPFDGTLSWIDTKTGNIISSASITSGSKTLTTPTFIEDIAFKIISSSSPSPTVIPSPVPSPSAKIGDIDGNGKIDIFDYNILLTNFNKTGTGIQGDINNSGKVDIFDYNLLLTNFGT